MVSEGALARLSQRAQEAWQRQDFPEYFKIMEQASRQDPANPALLLDMGCSHGMRYDYAAAERCFERAVRVAPNRSHALVMAALKCRSFDSYEMARSYLERAVKEPAASPDTLVKLAEIYERFRLVSEAGELVDRALHLEPGAPLPSLVRARLDRLQGKTAEAENRLRPLLASTGAETWSTRIRGWYELGAVLDAQGLYDEAMTAFLEAKALILPGASNFIAAEKLVHDRLKIAEEKLNPALVRRWRSQGPERVPEARVALLCGHPRSGTTLLEQVLDAHPDFISAEETPIFNREAFGFLLRDQPPGVLMLDALEAVSSAALQQARQNYLNSTAKFLNHSIDGRLLIDKNPSLTGLVPAFARVFPEAKFLVALRDPRDVCLSCFMQPLPLGQVSSIFLTLEGTVAEYVSMMGLWQAVSKCLDESFLEIRYEDLVEDLEGVARRALGFLGAAWDPRVLRFHEHAGQKLVRSPTYAAVARPISRGAVGRWHHYRKYLDPWLEALAPFTRAFGYNA